MKMISELNRRSKKKKKFSWKSDILSNSSILYPRQFNISMNIAIKAWSYEFKLERTLVLIRVVVEFTVAELYSGYRVNRLVI